jgi:DNA-3-methyladenine glycosylase
LPGRDGSETRQSVIGTPLNRRFFTRDSPALARALLGKVLVHNRLGRISAGLIVETEAYDQTDPASHSFNGETERNSVMFLGGGFAYVYLSYGVHWCFNVSADRPGYGSAVLIRALDPVEGIELMRRRRGLSRHSDPLLLTSGPGRLTQAMAITRRQNGRDLVSSSLQIVRSSGPLQRFEIETTRRIGISKAVTRQWRFLIAGNRFVSRSR